MGSIFKRAKSLTKAAAAFLGIRLIDPIEVFYLPSENIFYPIISKSACSSIKLMLIRRFIPRYESKFPGIHQVNPAPITNNQLQRIFFYKMSAYEKWAGGKKLIFIMREPISRFYSCYIDVKSGKNTMYQFPSGLDWFMNFKPGMSFTDFLSKVSRLGDSYADRHFRSQTFYLPESIRKSASALEIYSLSAFMESQKSNTGSQKVARLNTNADSISPGLKSELLKNQKFNQRFAADLRLYSEIIANE